MLCSKHFCTNCNTKPSNEFFSKGCSCMEFSCQPAKCFKVSLDTTGGLRSNSAKVTTVANGRWARKRWEERKDSSTLTSHKSTIWPLTEGGQLSRDPYSCRTSKYKPMESLFICTILAVHKCKYYLIY